jgi:hypothetical protein
LEGSQAVAASPSGKGEACIGDFFNFDFKDVGAAVVVFKSPLNPTGNILGLRSQPVCDDGKLIYIKKSKSYSITGRGGL